MIPQADKAAIQSLRTKPGYALVLMNEESTVLGNHFDTAQAAFDWLAENYPGIPTEVNIQ